MKMNQNDAVASNAAANEPMPETDDVRIVRRLPAAFGNLSESVPDGGRQIAILDIETTGLDVAQDAIIELAIMHVTIDADGHVIGHSKPMSWLEDPCVKLPQDIVRLTGLTDEDLRGQKLDAATIVSVLERCDVIVAHNAVFDAGFVHRRLPETRAMNWACSVREIDWLELGYPCRTLEHLLLEHGYFFDGHRAGIDVWATFQLLQLPVTARAQSLNPGSNDKTYLQHLLKSSEQGAVRMRAHGLPFAAKDWAKARGFSWDASLRVWFKDVPMSQYQAERQAFVDAGHPSPVCCALNAANRYCS